MTDKVEAEKQSSDEVQIRAELGLKNVSLIAEAGAAADRADKAAERSADEANKAIDANTKAQQAKTMATQQAATATIKAAEAKKSADDAARVVTGGTATINPEGGKIPLADSNGKIKDGWLSPFSKLPTDVGMEEIRSGLEHTAAASGFTAMGNTGPTTADEIPINIGMYAMLNVPNVLGIGRDLPDAVQSSNSNLAKVGIAGFETELRTITDSGVAKRCRIKFKEAPKGTETYNSDTGETFDYLNQADPKYGDIAATRAEAGARAFEGDIKNGDFRLGGTGWGSESYLTYTKGQVEITHPGSGGWVNSASSPRYPVGTKLHFEYYVDNPDAVPLRFNMSGSGVLEEAPSTDSGLKFGTCTVVNSSDYPQILFDGGQSFTGKKARITHFYVRRASVEVVTEPVDLFGFEGWLEEITPTNPFGYAGGRIQDQSADINGVPTKRSNRPSTYYAQYDGDTTSDGKSVDVLNATTKQQDALFSDRNNRFYWLLKADGSYGLFQWRVRARVVRGAGNGDWYLIDVSETYKSSNRIFGPYPGIRLMPHGAADVPYSGSSLSTGYDAWYGGNRHTSQAMPQSQAFKLSGGVWGAGNSSATVGAHNDECYFLVCGTVPRAAQAIYHPTLSPNGAMLAADGKEWFNSTHKFLTKADCFNPTKLLEDSGSIASGKSSHPDGIYYDAIQAGGINGVIDDRLSAWGAGSPAKAAQADGMVKSETYRGKEKLKFTQIATSTRSSTSNEFVNFNLGEIPDRAKNGDTVYVKANGSATYQKFTIIAVDPNGLFIRINANFNKEPLATVVFEMELNLTVSGEFYHKDVLGRVSDIQKVPMLQNGWRGTLVDPNITGSSQDFELTRPVSSGSPTGLATSDMGVTWNKTPLSSFNATTNELKGVVVQPGYVFLIDYKTKAKVTEPSQAASVIHGAKGLGEVFITQDHNKASLSESLAGIILKSDASGILTEQQTIVNYLLEGTLKRVKTSNTDLVAPTNSSQAIKVAVYQVEENGQAQLYYVCNTMSHNGSSWGEKDAIHIPTGTKSSEVFEDANNVDQLATVNKLAIPYGWVKNEV